MKKVRLNDTGFTLVEVLVTLLVFSVLSSATLGVFANAVQAKSAMQAKNEILKERTRLRALLKDDFANTIIRDVRDGNGNVIPVQFYIGDTGVYGSGLIGLTRVGWDNPEGLERRSDLQLVQYEMEKGKLVRVVYPRSIPAPDTQPFRQVLMEEIDGVATRVFYDGDWLSNWVTGAPPTGRPELPRIISIQIRLTDGTDFTQLFWLGADR